MQKIFYMIEAHPGTKVNFTQYHIKFQANQVILNCYCEILPQAIIIFNLNSTGLCGASS
jgi:hypothetical protein